MSGNVSIRDALLEIRQFVVEDAEKRAKIQELCESLEEAISDRVASAQRVVDTWTRLTGFNGDLDGLVVETKKEAKPVKQSTKRSTAATSKKTGFRGEVSPETSLSPLEENVLALLQKRWPQFVTPVTLERQKIVGHRSHAAATINRMRQKGVPIESAKQARDGGADISFKTTGYRLISRESAD